MIKRIDFRDETYLDIYIDEDKNNFPIDFIYKIYLRVRKEYPTVILIDRKESEYGGDKMIMKKFYKIGEFTYIKYGKTRKEKHNGN